MRMPKKDQIVLDDSRYYVNYTFKPIWDRHAPYMGRNSWAQYDPPPTPTLPVTPSKPSTATSKPTSQLLTNQTSPTPQPMHIHGHDMSILHEGAGFWDGSSITNAANPLRRDVQLLRPNGHIVVQYEANNPGVWPFHCHIAWHVSLGLYINLLEQPDEITSLSIPDVVAETCTNWDAYSNQNVVDEIDSGV